MTKEKEELNLFGKRKPSGKLVENFYISKEATTNRLKIEHKSGDFSFRIWAAEHLERYFDEWTKGEFAKAWAEVFSNIKIFIILSIQYPEYHQAWMQWHSEYLKSQEQEATDEQHEEALTEAMEEALNDDGAVEPDTESGPEPVQ